jgi:hypothetical protein
MIATFKQVLTVSGRISRYKKISKIRVENSRPTWKNLKITPSPNSAKLNRKTTIKQKGL